MSNVFTDILEQRKRRVPELIALAGAFDIVLEVREYPGSSGLYLGWVPPEDVGRVEVQLWCMAFNWRITEVLDDITIGRYWCYYGTDVPTFVTAVRALRAWRGDAAGEPDGWMKSSDGRTSPRYPV